MIENLLDNFSAMDDYITPREGASPGDIDYRAYSAIKAASALDIAARGHLVSENFDHFSYGSKLGNWAPSPIEHS